MSDSDNPGHCQNCSGVIPASGRFCPRCGQSTLDIRRPWLPLFKDLVGELFEWDGRMLATFRHLMLNPGHLTLEYAQGHRVRYTPPVRLYIVVSLIFFLAFPLIMPALPGQTSPMFEPATESYSRMMFVLLPVFALLVKLFYPKHFYLEHLVFSMHVFAAMFVVFALMLAMEGRADESVFWVAVQVLVFGYMIWYCLTALKTVYRQSWPKSAAKFAGLVALFLPTLSGALNLATLF